MINKGIEYGRNVYIQSKQFITETVDKWQQLHSHIDASNRDVKSAIESILRDQSYNSLLEKIDEKGNTQTRELREAMQATQKANEAVFSQFRDNMKAIKNDVEAQSTILNKLKVGTAETGAALAELISGLSLVNTTLALLKKDKAYDYLTTAIPSLFLLIPSLVNLSRDMLNGLYDTYGGTAGELNHERVTTISKIVEAINNTLTQLGKTPTNDVARLSAELSSLARETRGSG